MLLNPDSLENSSKDKDDTNVNKINKKSSFGNILEQLISSERELESKLSNFDSRFGIKPKFTQNKESERLKPQRVNVYKNVPKSDEEPENLNKLKRSSSEKKIKKQKMRENILKNDWAIEDNFYDAIKSNIDKFRNHKILSGKFLKKNKYPNYLEVKSSRRRPVKTYKPSKCKQFLDSFHHDRDPQSINAQEYQEEEIFVEEDGEVPQPRKHLQQKEVNPSLYFSKFNADNLTNKILPTRPKQINIKVSELLSAKGSFESKTQ